MPGPLSHIRVLDLSRIMAGPWATQLLADLGADVIKVERPQVGDDTRAWGPPFLRTPQGEDRHTSGYFLCANRAKRSLTLDFTKPKGQEVVRALAQRSDILFENFKVGTLARYGLAYDDLKAINPRLIYCSITGFGQSGPRRDAVAYDFMIQAMGGLMSVTGEADDQPGGGPQKVGVPVLDLMTGMYAGIGALAALARREVSGKGDYIDLAMLDVQAAMLANQAMNYLLTGRTPQRHGNGHPNIMPQQVFKCVDGEIVLAVGNDGQYAKLVEVLGDDRLRDPRFAKNAGRVEHREDMYALLIENFAEWQRGRSARLRWSKAGVPSARINSIPEALADIQAKHRGTLVDVPHPAAGHAHASGQPDPAGGRADHVSTAAARISASTPGKFCANSALADDDIASLKQDGVI